MANKLFKGEQQWDGWVQHRGGTAECQVYGREREKGRSDFRWCVAIRWWTAEQFYRNLELGIHTLRTQIIVIKVLQPGRWHTYCLSKREKWFIESEAFTWEHFVLLKTSKIYSDSLKTGRVYSTFVLPTIRNPYSITVHSNVTYGIVC